MALGQWAGGGGEGESGCGSHVAPVETDPTAAPAPWGFKGPQIPSFG